VRKYKVDKKIKLICLSNKIMYKGLYLLPSIIIRFEDRELRDRIARKAKVVTINKDLTISLD